MKVCDKCRGSVLTSLTSSIDGQVTDLCQSHYDEFLAWVSEKPEPESKDQPVKESKPRGRPRVRKT